MNVKSLLRTVIALASLLHGISIFNIGNIQSYSNLLICYQNHVQPIHKKENHNFELHECITNAAATHNHNLNIWRKQSGCPQTLSIGLLTFLTDDIKEYATYSAAINLAYAIHNNYYFKIYDPKVDMEIEYDTYDVRWNKIQVLRAAFQSDWGKDCDYFMWLDADLIFLDMDMDLPALLSSYPPAHFLASSEYTGSSTMINTGAMLVKHSKWSYTLLSTWWTFANRLFYSDQEQFDLLYHYYRTAAENQTNNKNKSSTAILLPCIKDKVQILAPYAINSDPPAMTQQQSHHQVLHLMGEETSFRQKVFSNGWILIMRHLQQFQMLKKQEGNNNNKKKKSASLLEEESFLLRTTKHSATSLSLSSSKVPRIYLHTQLGLTQEQLLFWTLEEYEPLVQNMLNSFVFPVVATATAKDDGDNSIDEEEVEAKPTRYYNYSMCRKLANTVHHFVHALDYFHHHYDDTSAYSYSSQEVIQQLRKQTYDLLMTNLQHLEGQILENQYAHSQKQQKQLNNNWTFPEDYLEIKKQVVITGQQLLQHNHHTDEDNDDNDNGAMKMVMVKEKITLCKHLQTMLQEMILITHIAQQNALIQMSISLDYELGKYYLQLQEYNQAFVAFHHYYHQSKELSISMGPFVLIQPLEYMGNIYAIQEQYEKAYEMFEQAIDIIEKHYEKEYSDSLLTLYFNYALAYYHAQQWDACDMKLQKVMHLLSYHYPQEEERLALPLYQQVMKVLKDMLRMRNG